MSQHEVTQDAPPKAAPEAFLEARPEVCPDAREETLLGGAAAFYDGYWDHRLARGDADSPKRIKLRHEQAVNFVAAHVPVGGSVLDLGCGDGILGQMLSPRGYRVTGADVSARVLQVAQPHHDRVVLLDLDRDPTPAALQSAFDAVACLEVLEHLETPQKNLQRAFDCCRPGGVAVFSYPNLFSWKNRWSFVRGRWPSSYTTYDPREHLQVFELSVFERWLREAGFQLLGRAITPDLPRWKPLRQAMFRARGPLARVAPVLCAMQINLFARKPDA